MNWPEKVQLLFHAFDTMKVCILPVDNTTQPSSDLLQVKCYLCLRD